MKFALALVTLCLAATQAHADFVPGRVRADAVAKMEVLEATGKYENVKSVTIYQNSMDGGGIVSFTAVIEGQKIDFTITKSSDTGCGNTFKAQSLDNMASAETSTFELRDMGRALCERVIAAIWENTVIKTKNLATGEVSTLKMQGNPEALMRTM